MPRNIEDDNDYDDEFEDFDGSRLVKDLRKQLKEALKAKEELAEQVSSLSKVTRSTQLKDVLASKNLNPKLAAFYPGDGEVTPEAVDAWVQEYADVFGIQTQEEQADPAQTAEAELHQRMQRTSESGASEGADPAKFADLSARINSAQSLEELQQILAGQ